MIKLFQRIFWHNNTTPAINEDNLNAMSKAIDDIDNRVIELGTDVLTVVPQIQSYLAQAEDLVEAMENLSKHPPYIGANGNWYVWDTETSTFVDSGIDASITVQIADVTMIPYGQTPYITNTGTNTDPIFHLFLPAPSSIKSIVKTATAGLVDTYTVTFDDGSTATFTVTNGKSIVSIAKTATAGLVDTYTVTFNDGTTTTFDVTNGRDGTDGDDGRGITSIAKTATSGLVDTYTITYTDGTTSTFTVTNGRDGQGAGDMLQSDYDPQGIVYSAGGIPAYVILEIAGKANSADLAAVAFSGSYSSLSDQPTIPAATSISHTGTASDTGVRYQRIGIGNAYTEIDGTKYMEQTQTLSTSADTTFTFTNNAITADSEIWPLSSIFGLSPSDITVSAGSCVVTIPKHDTAVSLKVRIYIR